MVKIGPVGEYEFGFYSQELIPENETELKNIIKVCIEKGCSFFVDIFDKPIECTTAIGKVVFEAKWCVFTDKEFTHDIIDEVEEMGG